MRQEEEYDLRTTESFGFRTLLGNHKVKFVLIMFKWLDAHFVFDKKGNT